MTSVVRPLYRSLHRPIFGPIAFWRTAQAVRLALVSQKMPIKYTSRRTKH